MIGEVIIFCGQEYKVLAHRSDYIKAIQLDSPFFSIKLLPYSKIHLPENVLESIKIDDLWTI